MNEGHHKVGSFPSSVHHFLLLEIFMIYSGFRSTQASLEDLVHILHLARSHAHHHLLLRTCAPNCVQQLDSTSSHARKRAARAHISQQRNMKHTHTHTHKRTHKRTHIHLPFETHVLTFVTTNVSHRRCRLCSSSARCGSLAPLLLRRRTARYSVALLSLGFCHASWLRWRIVLRSRGWLCV
jgi:hypothetical protein